MAPGECVVVVLAGRDSAAIPAHTGGGIYGMRGVYPKTKKGESVPVHSVVHQHRGCPYDAVAFDSGRPVARVLGSRTHTEFGGANLPPLAAAVKAARNLGEPGFTRVCRQRHPAGYGRQTMKAVRETARPRIGRPCDTRSIKPRRGCRRTIIPCLQPTALAAIPLLYSLAGHSGTEGASGAVAGTTSATMLPVRESMKHAS